MHEIKRIMLLNANSKRDVLVSQSTTASVTQATEKGLYITSLKIFNRHVLLL